MKHFLPSIFILTICIFNTNAQKATITSPNGGEEWLAGNTESITWINDTGNVSLSMAIEYSIDGGATWILIDGMAPNTESYSWKVPNTPSPNCYVRLGNDTSNADFAIFNPCNMGIMSQDDTICLGVSVTLTAQVTMACTNLTYEWLPGNSPNSSINVSPTATTTFTLTADDGNNIYTDTLTVYVENCSGIEENTDIDKYTIAFNRNEKQITVNFLSDFTGEIRFYNPAGQLINRGNTLRSSEKTFSTVGLPEGLYFIRLQTSKGVSITKIALY